MRSTLLLRAGAVLAAATVGTLVLASPASAHVTVNSNQATQGGFTKVAFRVPNEKDTASTVKLEVNFPTDTPIASVSLKPVAGWTAQSERTKLATPIKSDDGEITEAVSKVTWTAAPGAVIKPGQFQEFEVSLGPLPDKDQIVFKTLQTYSDGEIVRWIEEPTGGAEPEHPAPVLKLTKAEADAPAAPAQPQTNTDDSDEGGNGTTLILGIAGLAAGLAGLVTGLLAYRRANQTPTTA